MSKEKFTQKEYDYYVYKKTIERLNRDYRFVWNEQTETYDDIPLYEEEEALARLDQWLSSEEVTNQLVGMSRNKQIATITASMAGISEDAMVRAYEELMRKDAAGEIVATDPETGAKVKVNNPYSNWNDFRHDLRGALKLLRSTFASDEEYDLVLSPKEN